MEGVCRLCCGGACVTWEIFDEARRTHDKLAACLPVKVFKNDQLPQKICNKCCNKLDEFYQFCNEAVASQARLRESVSVYAPNKILPDFSDCVDLTIKENVGSPSPDNLLQPDLKPAVQYESKCTQTEDLHETILAVKDEKPLPSQIKIEHIKDTPGSPVTDVPDYDEDNYIPSDYSDDISLKMLKKKKKKQRKEKTKGEKVNGEVKKGKKRKKKDIDDAEISKSENPIIKDTSVEPGVSLEAQNGIKIKQEWMNLNFESGLLDAVTTQYLDPSMIKTEPVYEAEAWYCCVCFTQCPNRNDMLTHYRSHVSTEPVKRELDCEPDIVVEDELNPNKYKCKLCNKAFNKKYSLEKHTLVHENKRPYRCSLCEKTFREVNQILKHGQTHTYETPQVTPVAECIVQDCETALKGELCPDHHLVVRPRNHPQPLSKRFVCDLCDEGFVYMRYLIEHRNRTHPEARERKFVNRCMHCSREFAHLNSLRRHLRSHTGERNFLCNVCGKALSSREHLKFHIRIHTGYKPNVCKTCGKGFVKKCNLTLHERVHSGEKPHVCSHCGKAFSQRSTLVIHERYHSGARPYVCTLCGKGFVAKGLLSMHLKTTCI